jgi:hypothetical protein
MPKKVTREEAMSAAADLRKILASKGPIKSGRIKPTHKTRKGAPLVERRGASKKQYREAKKLGKKVTLAANPVKEIVEKEVPRGYILIVNNTKPVPESGMKTKRMPLKAFVQGVQGSSITDKQKEALIKRAKEGDREIYTANKKVLKEFRL